MRRDTHLLPALLTAGLGGFLIWRGISMPHARGWSSSPGLFPIIIGLVLSILALMLMVERQKLRKVNASPSASGMAALDYKVVGVISGSLVIYILSLRYLPYEPPTFVYLALGMWAFGNRSVVAILTASFIFTGLISVLFTQVLGTLIPGTYSILDLLLY